MDGSADKQGKPPRSAAAIRNALESVRQSAGPAPEAGPHQHGLAGDAPVVIASFYDREVASGFVRLLVGAGIMSATLRRGFRQDQVLVDCGDRRLASELLLSYRLGTPDRSAPRFRRSVDFMLLGAAIGGVLIAIGIAGETASGRTLLTGQAAASVCGFAVYGGIVGFFLGHVGGQTRRAGRLQFGIVDLLLATTLFSLLFLAWHALIRTWQ